MPHQSFQRDFSPASASDPSEDGFLRGLQQKAEWAFRQLIDQWSEKIYRLAYRFLGKAEDAEEIVQEVLQKVVKKIETFRGDSSLYTWVYRIAVNQSLMKLRAMKGKQCVSWEECPPHFEDGMRTQTVADWSQLPEERFLQK